MDEEVQEKQLLAEEGDGMEQLEAEEGLEATQLEPDGAKHMELEPDGIKELAAEKELVSKDSVAAPMELITHSGVNLEPRWRRHDPKPPWFLIQAQEISKWACVSFVLFFPCAMASEEEEEETSRESPSSLNEAMLEQIKKMMIEEFDRREKIKEGKRKQPKDPVTSKKKPIEDLSGYMMIPPFHGNNDPDVFWSILEHMGHKEHGGTWHMEAAQLDTQRKKGEAILKTSSTVYSTNRSSSSTRPAKLQLDRAGSQSQTRKMLLPP
ncbi:unnamed protein product [Microthlaspi erraticum]|uniref:Uncharacterized protein n=1 Tax=Microthlaspi erraticum TaxID=1685480 RepID=A0A6D2JIA6_9BRAS|nr:unnamed protein product [Microthlaspi erraticum]